MWLLADCMEDMQHLGHNYRRSFFFSSVLKWRLLFAVYTLKNTDTIHEKTSFFCSSVTASMDLFNLFLKNT
jgi:hypothetical protein